MCTFPSWYEESDGTVIFLTDKDLSHFVPENMSDAVGHYGLRKVFPNVQGVQREGFPPPDEIVRAIDRGQMRKLMGLDNYLSVVRISSGWEGVKSDGSWWQRRYKAGKLDGLWEWVNSAVFLEQHLHRSNQ